MLEREVVDVVYAVGIDPAVVSGHSLRSALATTMARNGASEREIAKRGRWRQGSARRQLSHIRDGGAFVDSGADKIGL